MKGQQEFVCTAISLMLLGLTLIGTPAYGNTLKGKTLFLEHCAECHGVKGDGTGAVGLYLEEQRPANLLAETTRARSDDALFEIIRYGVHLEMPSWEDVLHDQEILNIIRYLRVLAPSSPAADH